MLFAAATVCPALPAGQRHTLKRRLRVKLGSLSPPVCLRHRGRYGDPMVRPLQPSSPFVPRPSLERGRWLLRLLDQRGNRFPLPLRAWGHGERGADDTLGGVSD